VPAIIEMTGYHADGRGLATGVFLPSQHPVTTLTLTAVDRLRKKRMIDCFASQRELLAGFASRPRASVKHRNMISASRLPEARSITRGSAGRSTVRSGDSKPGWPWTGLAHPHAHAVDGSQCRLSIRASRARHCRRRGAGALGARPGSGRGRPLVTGGRLCRLADHRQAVRHGRAHGQDQRRRPPTRAKIASAADRRGPARMADRHRPLSWSRFCRVLADALRADLGDSAPAGRSLSCRSSVKLPSRAVLQTASRPPRSGPFRTATRCCRRFPMVCRSRRCKPTTQNGSLP
jgi:hypothetical protein